MFGIFADTIWHSTLREIWHCCVGHQASVEMQETALTVKFRGGVTLGVKLIIVFDVTFGWFVGIEIVE